MLCFNAYLNKSNVKILKCKKHGDNFLNEVKTFMKKINGNLYVWKTCYLKFFELKIPCQAVANKIPETIGSLNKLDNFLICNMMLFEKLP